MTSHHVTRFLHDDTVARVDQDAGTKVEPLLRTGHHHDLLGFASDAPRTPEVSLQFLPQDRISGGNPVGETSFGFEKGLGQCSPPQKRGKIRRRQVPIAEIECQAGMDRGSSLGQLREPLRIR
ncbi:hypothetical protein AJ87_13675 [Rhizobium yanglingense]|nr:hypothetical protein AJ87_13675 [Rhizobium yanglingense]